MSERLREALTDALANVPDDCQHERWGLTGCVHCDVDAVLPLLTAERERGTRCTCRSGLIREPECPVHGSLPSPPDSGGEDTRTCPTCGTDRGSNDLRREQRAAARMALSATDPGSTP